MNTKLRNVLLLLAVLAPLAALFWPSEGQIAVKNGALSGITTMPSYWPIGELTMRSNATATVINSAGVYTNMAGTTVLSSLSTGFDMPQNNRLRYTNSTTATMHIACTISYSVAAGSNQELRAQVWKNGTNIIGSEIRDTCGNSSDTESTAIHTSTTMSQNDYIELFITNQSAANNFTISTFNIFALGMR
jgi:hypothetical protein